MTEGSTTRAALVEQAAAVADLTKTDAIVVVDTMIRRHRRCAPSGREDRTPRFRQLPPPATLAAQGPQPEDRRPGGRAAEARTLLQARQGAEGADQPRACTGRTAAVVRVGERGTATPSAVRVLCASGSPVGDGAGSLSAFPYLLVAYAGSAGVVECFADAARTEGAGAEVAANAALVERAVDFAGGYCGSVDCTAVGAAFDDGLFSFGPDGDVAVQRLPAARRRLVCQGWRGRRSRRRRRAAYGHRARGSRRRVPA